MSPPRTPPPRRPAGRGGASSARRRASEHALRRRRLRLLWIGSAGALVVLVARLGMVQVLNSSRYTAYAAGETEQRMTLPATRGSIYDRTGHLLAVSVPTVNVVADDFQITHPLSEANQLAPILHLSAVKLASELSQRNGYVVIAANVNQATASKAQSLYLNGISFLPSSQRSAPDASLFEPILGGLNPSGTGVTGLEGMENATLAGKPGSELAAVGPGGVALPSAVSHVVPARPGRSLVLTIDEPLQVEVTKDLTAEMKLTHAHSGVAVVESVQTGAILAMVDLVAGPKGVIGPASTNLALTSVYEPGSVMKLSTYSFALKDGVINPQTPFTVPYSLTIGGYTFYDAEYHPTQIMTASQMLAQSSNVGTIELAHKLGMNQVYAGFRAFGYGQPTGMHWPGASPGILGTPSSWIGSDTGSVPIGTGVAVTPQQILDAYTAAANGGVLPVPHLVAGTIGPSGKERLIKYGPGRRAIPTSVDHEIVPMLEGVVHNGTAACAVVPGYTVAGKTGTSQIPTAHGYNNTAFNATFVGFLPAQAPKLSAVVTLNHPTIIYGGSAAAPVFAKVMEYAVGHFDVAPIGPPQRSVLQCTATSGA